jgi:hypothetical protein
METVRHWINNEPVSAEGARTGEVFNPATGEVARRVVYSRWPTSTPPWRPPRRPSSPGAAARWRSVPGCSSPFASWSTAAATTSRGCSPWSTARCFPTRRARCSAASRSSSSRAASPISLKGDLLGERIERRRQLLAAAAAGRGGRHHPVQLPRDGADVDVSAGHRLRQHVRAQALRARPLGHQLLRRAPGGRRVAAGRVQRRAWRQGGRGPPAGAPRRGRGELRGLHPHRALHLRDRHPQRQARAGAGRRQEPHGGAARRRHGPRRRRRRVRAAYGSAGERCMAISVLVAVGNAADKLLPKIKERIAKLKVGDGLTAGARRWARSSPGAPRQGGWLRRQRRRRGRDPGRRPRPQGDRPRAASSWARALFDTCSRT